MGTRIEIIGQPLLSLEFIDVPSWNDKRFHGHWGSRHTMVKFWRTEGARLADNTMRNKRIRPVKGYLVKRRAFILARVYVPHEGVMDITNVSLKAIKDGFTDARVWTDDEWPTLPTTLFTWAGIDMFGRRRTVLDIHELDSLIINGQALNLPAGRIE